MSEWQPQTQEPDAPIRVKWFIMLAESMEEIAAAYLMGQIDRDEYENQLRDLDGKLGIIGLSLAVKPWEKNAKRL